MALPGCFPKFYVLLLAMFVLSFCIPSFGQSESAALSGTITDPSGAVVPGAEVKLTNVNTGITVTVPSNKDGLYVFPNIHPGQYRMVVDKVGFRQVVLTDITLNVQDVLSRNFKLELGVIGESVTVSATAETLNTTSATVSTVVDSQFVEKMPLNGRSFQSLILLTPGITAVPNAGVGNQGEFSVNGQRTEANYYTVDGVSANTGSSGNWMVGGTPQETALGTTQSLVSVDDLQEFRISTSTYSAEYGRNPGAQISLTTRSGANIWHSSAYDYLRNDALDANNWFNDNAGLPKTAERQNDFGGTLGGPVLIPEIYNGKDKTFFFFSYEGLRLTNPQPALTVDVPDMSLRQTAPSAIQPLLNQFPLPNGTDLGNGVALFTGTYSAPSNINAYSIRIDHTFGNKLSLFGRYADTPSYTQGRGPNFVGVNNSNSNIKSLTLGAAIFFSPRLANELRFNYTKNNSSSLAYEDDFGGATPLTVAEAFPGITPPKYFGFDAYFAFLQAQPGLYIGAVPSNQWNITDSLSSTYGAHMLKYGIDYRRQGATESSCELCNDFYYLSVNDVMKNAASFADVFSAENTSPKAFFTNFSAFVEDEWEATNRLHLSLGLRWDLNPPPTSNHPLYALDQITDLATTNVAPKGTPLYHTDYRGFAPRIGVAYQLRQKPGHETVMRAGVGLFYDTGNANSLFGGFQGLSTGNNYSSAAFPFTPAQQVVPPPTFEPPYGAFAAPDPYLRLPYTLQWNVAVQQQLGTSQTLTLTYVGSGGRKLLRSSEVYVSGNPNFTPGAPVSIVTNASSSGYNALQMQFQRILSHGLEVLASYTWSHSIDNLSFNGNWSSGTGTYEVLDRGNSDFDVRHNFSAALTYDVPGSYANPLIGAVLKHWGVDLRQTARTALPVDVNYGSATLPNGQSVNTRPDIVPGVPFYVSDPTAPGGRVINYYAFTAPAGLLGDAPRNFLRDFTAWQTDLAIRREFHIFERLKLEFRAESFNLFNHPNFGQVDSYIPDGPTLFGRSRATLNNSLGGLNSLYQMGGPRSLQLGLRLKF
jgi:hypothetical protein